MMPITTVFAAGDTDYIQKLNQFAAEHNASTGEVLAVGEALAGQVEHVDAKASSASDSAEAAVGAKIAAVEMAQQASDSAFAANAAKGVATTKAGEASDSAGAAQSAKNLAVAARNEAAGFAAQSLGVMGVIAGEVRNFCGTSAPAGWALCQGQMLNIADHPALWSVLGTSYGGDGVSTFALPVLASIRPQGARISSIEAGDSFTAHLPGPVDATYTSLAGDGVNQVAAGLAASITASAGYGGQAFTIALDANEITLTAKVAGDGFDVTATTPTAPAFSVVTDNDVGVVQVCKITIENIKAQPWPATHCMIYLG